MARREVLENIGRFDDRFGLGFFEDDDLCFRASQAGYKLLVIPEVYIHHFGSRTITGLGIDGPAQLRTNFAKLQAKWGQEKTAGYRLQDRPRPEPSPALLEAVTEFARIPEVPPASVRILANAATLPTEPVIDAAFTPTRPYSGRVSLCLIVRNEENNLAECLASAADLVHEIVVVDTGSTDRTKDIAREWAATVVEFPWVDHFAAARNEALRHATGDWIFWLDADDRLDADNRPKLQQLFANLKDENAGYAMKCRCWSDPETSSATVVDHVRLFRNRPDIRWQYRVHEQILPAIRRTQGEVHASDIVIQHVGYVDADLRRKKQERNLRLLLQDGLENPNDAFINFNLGWTYEEMGQPTEALVYLQKSLRLSHPSDSIVRKLYTLIKECHRQLGQVDQALACCREGRRHYPHDAQLLFQEAALLQNLNDERGAEQALLTLIQGEEGPHFASVAEGLRTYKARHNLAALYQKQGRLAEAEAQWREALKEYPGFRSALVGLGELLLGQGRLAEVQILLRQLEALPVAARQDTISEIGFNCRYHMACKEFALAKDLLTKAIEQYPREAYLWVVLSHAYLQEGKDWDKAEATLRTILDIEPANPEAQRNLGVLLRQQGKAGHGS